MIKFSLCLEINFDIPFLFFFFLFCLIKKNAFANMLFICIMNEYIAIGKFDFSFVFVWLDSKCPQKKGLIWFQESNSQTRTKKQTFICSPQIPFVLIRFQSHLLWLPKNETYSDEIDSVHCIALHNIRYFYFNEDKNTFLTFWISFLLSLQIPRHPKQTWPHNFQDEIVVVPN